MSPGVPDIGYTYLSLLDSPELLQVLMTLTTLTAKLLSQGYRYFKLRKAFLKFYRTHNALVEKYSVSLKTLLQQGISEPEFYGNLVYRFRKIVENLTFRSNSENLLTVIKEWTIVWILCGRLHA